MTDKDTGNQTEAPEVVTESTVPDWNELLQKTFPDGALVTFVASVEESSKHDDSPQDPTGSVMAFAGENESIVFSFHSLETGRHFLVDVEEVQKRPYGFFVKTAGVGTMSLMLSNKMSENQRQFIAQAKSQLF